MGGARNRARLTVHEAVELFAIIHLTVVGVSHVLAPKAWARFFALLREQGHAGVFVVAFMSLWFGSIVAAFHPVWSGIPAVLTVVGWAQVAKGLLYFTWPAFGLRQLGRVPEERARLFIPGGLLLLGLAALLGYHRAVL